MKKYEGTIIANSHIIAFRYWSDYNFPEELCEELNKEAESRAKEMTAENYTSGELKYEDEDYNIRGWWEVE